MGMGLINATGTKAPDIEFLKRHHIWLASGNHLGDPPWVCSSVCADAPVDIVGHDAQRSWPCMLVPAVEWIHRLLKSMLAHLKAWKCLWTAKNTPVRPGTSPRRHRSTTSPWTRRRSTT